MNRLLLRYLLVAICLLSLTNVMKAQSPCGSVVSSELIEKEKKRVQEKLLKAGYETVYPEKINRTLEITIIALNLDSSIMDRINDTLAIVNHFFEPIGLSFKACSLIYPHNDNKYATFVTYELANEAKAKYNKKNTINMYIVDRLESPSVPNTEVCGYAPLGISFLDIEYIFIQCNDVSTITHELGHLFGLFHTHDTDFGKELADSSDCAITGDLICDTPADPNLLVTIPNPLGPSISFYLVNSNCEYDGVKRDSKNHSYTPHAGNIMSYSDPKCYCFFTKGQYDRMRESYFNYKKNLR